MIKGSKKDQNETTKSHKTTTERTKTTRKRYKTFTKRPEMTLKDAKLLQRHAKRLHRHTRQLQGNLNNSGCLKNNHKETPFPPTWSWFCFGSHTLFRTVLSVSTQNKL